jgi:uridine phosphorylase
VNPDLGPVGEVDGAGWRTVLGLADRERPVAVVVEGTWWRDEHTRRRLERLDGVRELGIPDVYLGASGGRQLIYACPYGAPRTAEVVQVAALVGAELAVQLGSCGVLDPDIRPGDVVVPSAALGLDGTSALYASDTLVAASSDWTGRALTELERRGVAAHRGPSVTWPTLFNQPTDLVRRWSAEGYLGVDMETAATLAVARRFGAAGTSMLVAWDEVLSDRSFLDPLPGDQQQAFEHADEEIFEVALALLAGL